MQSAKLTRWFKQLYFSLKYFLSFLLSFFLSFFHLFVADLDSKYEGPDGSRERNSICTEHCNGNQRWNFDTMHGISGNENNAGHWVGFLVRYYMVT